MLALLLARRGVNVTLLEKHHDFDRDFRGDTLHPSTLELLDQMGLADSLLELPHRKIEAAELSSPAGTFRAADFSLLKTKFPFVALMPQERFLEFIVNQAKQYANFQLRLGANAGDLIRDEQDRDRILGIKFNDDSGPHQITSQLTVGCDGRFSRIRKQSQLELIRTAPPMDILWFRIPHAVNDSAASLMGRIDRGTMLIVLPREDHDQIGLVILKGSFRKIRDDGIEAFRSLLHKIAPTLGNRVETIEDWKQVTPLSVESSRLRKWHLPGLLMIGDAAHVMSPVGGVGINYAIQDAVATANLLGTRLKSGAHLSERELDSVRRRREVPTRIIQRFQAMVQQRVIRVALDPTKPFRPPWFLTLPFIRRLPAWLVGIGVGRERITE